MTEAQYKTARAIYTRIEVLERHVTIIRETSPEARISFGNTDFENDLFDLPRLVEDYVTQVANHIESLRTQLLAI